MTATKPQTRQRRLIEAGYKAEQSGMPCNAPQGIKEIERGAWEQGWRAARSERQQAAKESK